MVERVKVVASESRDVLNYSVDALYVITRLGRYASPLS